MSEEKKRAEEDEESVQRKIDEALACTCVSDLKEGPCGEPFVEAFSCFIRSQDIQVGWADGAGAARRGERNLTPRLTRALALDQAGHGLLGRIRQAQGESTSPPWSVWRELFAC